MEKVMIELLMSLALVLGFTFMYLLIRNSEKSISKKIVKELSNSIQKTALPPMLDLIHPKVWEVYNDFKSKPESWKTRYCTISNGKDEIWASNERPNRRFHPEDSMNYAEINSKLTHYDELILDSMCKKVSQTEKFIEETYFPDLIQ